MIKMEQPSVGEPARQFPPYFLGDESAYFLAFHCNRKSLRLNLQNPQGREVFYKGVHVSDVVLENYRPSVPPRLMSQHNQEV